MRELKTKLKLHCEVLGVYVNTVTVTRELITCSLEYFVDPFLDSFEKRTKKCSTKRRNLNVRRSCEGLITMSARSAHCAGEKSLNT